MNEDVQTINQLFGGTDSQNISSNTSSGNPNVDTINQLFSQESSGGSSPWDEFKRSASDIASKENFPVSVLLGQAALESAKGTSYLAKTRNNYFGMNAVDSNPGQATSYKSPEDSIKDYINLIKNTPRYSAAYRQYLKDHDVVKLIQGIKAGGYATDPDYVTKVLSQPEFKENI